jgi:hypothetical protein
MPLLIRATLNFIQFWHTRTSACFVPEAGDRYCKKVQMKRAIGTIHGKEGGHPPIRNVRQLPWLMISPLLWSNPANSRYGEVRTG